MRIKFDETDWFARVYDVRRYLVLHCPEKYDINYSSVRYLITPNSGATYIISNNYARIDVPLYDSWPQKKALTSRNIKILIKVFFQ